MINFKTDYDSGLPAVPAAHGGGEERVLGCLPPIKSQRDRFPRYESKRPSIPRQEWQEVHFRKDTGPSLDQNGIGACGAFAGAHGLIGSRARFGMRTDIPFSPWFLYGMVNGGRDGGSVMSDVMAALLNKGICTLNEVGPKQIYASRYSQEAYRVAERFRAAQCYECQTFDEIATALQFGELVVFGVLIGENFEPDSRGIIPSTPRGQKGGHAMCADGLTKINGVWYIDDKNSWGSRWGLDGGCYLPESYFGGWCNAFVIQAPAYDPQEQQGPAAIAA